MGYFRHLTRGARGIRKLKAALVWVLVLALMSALYPKLERVMDSADAAIAPIEGRVTHVRDGDTIEVGPIAIRFRTLDCAERGTQAGDRATAHLRQLADGEEVICDLDGRQSFDREIGSCRLSDGRDLDALMLETGVCERFR